MSVIQSDGELARLEQPWQPLGSSAGAFGVANFGAGGIRLYGEHFATYAAIYRSQPNVRTVVSFLARNIAQVGIHVFKRVSDTDRVRDANHPLAQLLRKPRPGQHRYRLINELVSDLGIYDIGFWLKVRAADRLALVRIPPSKVAPKGNSWLDPDEWVITGNRGRMTVPADSMVVFRGYNPEDPRVGLSPLETLRRNLAEEFAAGTYRENLWRKGSRAELVITRPENAPKMSPEAKERFWARWNAQHSGEGGNPTALLEEGMDVKEVSFSAKDTQYIEGRKINLEESVRLYHLPLPMVGVLDNANYSNMVEAHKNLYQDALGPWFVDLEETIEGQLLPELDLDPDTYVEFNINEKLKGSFEEQATSLQTMVGRPVMTANEGRARLNLPRSEDPTADRLVTPLNVLVGGQASPTDSVPTDRGGTRSFKAAGAGTDEPAEAMPTFLEQHRNIIGGYLDTVAESILSTEAKARRKSTDDVAAIFDADHWTELLSPQLYQLATLVADDVGPDAADRLGGEYDGTLAVAFLLANALYAARNINETITNELAAALAAEDPAGALEETLSPDRIETKTDVLARARLNAAAHFAEHEGSKQAGAQSKTWQTLSPNPRPSHAAMNGETVGIDDLFSNGGRWPHDFNAGVDEVAGCSCSVTYNAEEA